MKKRIVSLLLSAATGCLLASGCRFQKEIKVSLSDLTSEAATEAENLREPSTEAGGDIREKGEERNMSTTYAAITIKNRDVDLDAITEAFLSLSTEEAAAFRPDNVGVSKGTYYYEYQECELTVSTDASYIEFYDETDGAGSCYAAVIDPFGSMTEFLCSNLRRLYPEEGLENCSREEALLMCQPYAEACGFSDYLADTYAITTDVLDYLESTFGFQSSAPGAGGGLIRRSERNRLESEGKTDEANAYWQKRHEVTRRGIPWTKDKEAIFVVYREIIDGLPLDNRFESLVLLYVPAYGQVMYANGYFPSEKIGETGAEATVTAEEALAEALLYIGAESQKDIELKGASLVYSYRPNQGMAGLESRIADPCWRFDYVLIKADEMMLLLADKGTVLVDAVDGRISSLLFEN